MLKKIPYSFLPVRTLRNLSRPLWGIGEKLAILSPFLEINLKRADIDMESREYLSICLVSISLFFILMWIFLGIVLFAFNAKNFLLVSLAISLIFSFFAFFQQITYPRLIGGRKIRATDKNLLAALQDILV